MRERQGAASASGRCPVAEHRRRSRLVWAGGILSACASVLGLVSPQATGAQSPQPAFFAWQAPGDAWTAGYPVEDHTWSHPDLTTLAAAEVGAQLDRTQAEIASVTGEFPTCVRPLFNAWDPTVLATTAARGLTAMSYSVDPKDWSMPGVATIVSRVVAAAAPGAVVDLHDGGGNRSETVAALP